jgi:hypothetical protein
MPMFYYKVRFFWSGTLPQALSCTIIQTRISEISFNMVHMYQLLGRTIENSKLVYSLQGGRL